MRRRTQRGDTIVEVMVAFAVFTLVAVGSIMLMNQGLSLAQRSLEITLVRQQIDAQAELLRYARDTDASAWGDIKGNLASGGESCYLGGDLPSGAFFMNINSTGDIEYRNIGATPFPAASVDSRVTFGDGGAARTEGLWIMPVRVGGTGSNTYDMHIRACWYSVGSDTPVTLGTIVRLYDT